MDELKDFLQMNAAYVPPGYLIMPESKMTRSEIKGKGVNIEFYGTPVKRVYGPTKPLSRCISPFKNE